jgi:outer membrane protein insertion porin family
MFGTADFLCSSRGADPVKTRHTSLSGIVEGAVRWAWIALLLVLATGATQGAAQTPDTITQIRVIGNRRIPKETILARMFTHEGDTYDPISIERDFNSLWNTGYFDDLRIEREESEKGIILNVFVRE